MFESQGSTGATEIGSCLQLVCPNQFFSPICEELSTLKQAVDKLKWIEKNHWTDSEIGVGGIYLDTDRLKDFKVLDRIFEIFGRTYTQLEWKNTFKWGKS